MRLFIGTDIPTAILEAVSAMRNELKPLTDSVRWVRPESLHLTLKFLGEVAEERVDGIDRRLAGIKWDAFKVSVSGVGFFPNRRAPRVLWAGVSSPGLSDLAGQVDRGMVEEGFEGETRAFGPHLTLARSRRDRRMDRGLIETAERFVDHNFGSFEAHRFFFYRSHLKAGGAIYDKMFEYPAVQEKVIRDAKNGTAARRRMPGVK